MRARPALRWSRLRPLSRLRADERGYTLSELLVVMVILGVVLAALAGVFVSSTKAEVDMNLRFQAQQEARLALDQLRREGHCARALMLTSADRITLTYGAHCRAGTDGTTSIPLPITAAATSFNVGTITGTFPGVPFHVSVGSVTPETMRVIAVSGSTWTVERARLGTTAQAQLENAPVRLVYATTWCTSPEGTRWALRRIEGEPATCSGGKIVARHLDQNVFSFAAATATQRATLGVSFFVSVEGTTRPYRLQDAIVLRNTRRA